jgi:DNA-binding transcriptional regulator LsrR (DeoR family)
LSLIEDNNRLFERRRRVAHLHYGDYLTITEIAAELGVSEKTVDRDLKSRSARAVKGRIDLATRRENEELIEKFQRRIDHLSLEERFTLIVDLMEMSPEDQRAEVLRIIQGGTA